MRLFAHNITSFCERLCREAKIKKCNVTAKFNGIAITATPRSNPLNIEKNQYDKVLDQLMIEEDKVMSAAIKAHKAKWSRRRPKKDGYYWHRSHGGFPVIGWYKAGKNTMMLCGGYWPLEMTADYISTQDIEFHPVSIVPPKTYILSDYHKKLKNPYA